MSPRDREFQAVAFLDWNRNRGGDWESNFAFWSTSKDFQPSDARAIRRLVEAELIGGGRAVVTDLDFVPPPPPRSRSASRLTR